MSNYARGLLTNHAEILQYIHHYLLWLCPVLGFWSVALMLQGYFLGLTEGPIIRNSMLQAMYGFLPVACLASLYHQEQLLWLALLLFVALRAITLGLQVPKSLSQT